MARWEPGARERLVFAAVDLFNEQGYDATTVAEIAARAGVTKSTFFRYFPDKREILVAGQETLSELLAGHRRRSGGSKPARGRGQRPRCVSSAMGPMNRDLGPRMKAAVAANTELQERDALKRVGLAAAMTALWSSAEFRTRPHIWPARWESSPSNRASPSGATPTTSADHDLAHYTLSALNELRAAATSLG